MVTVKHSGFLIIPYAPKELKILHAAARVCSGIMLIGFLSGLFHKKNLALVAGTTAK